MPRLDIVRSTPVYRSVRVQQAEGIFDIPPSEATGEEWHVDLPIDDQPWHIGLIVGPSGCGKSTLARELFGGAVCAGFDWSPTRSLLDGFSAGVSIKKITETLSHVGFSAPPLWLRPFHVLSTGQQMRVTIARLLMEQPDLAVMDEFTSVVDRTVAQIGSSAIAKTVRRQNQRFVAVTCHYDVMDWLQPDWVYEPHLDRFQWRCLQRRPAITLEIQRVHHSAWELFRPYHYLSHTHQQSARCFAALLNNEPVAFVSVLYMPHSITKTLHRIHRAVCLPDYQGVGIGSALIAYVASAYRAVKKRITITTALPALIAGYSHDNRWICTRKPSLATPLGSNKGRRPQALRSAIGRLTASWEYIGPMIHQVDAQELIYGH